jgi:hypothetical protein
MRVMEEQVQQNFQFSKGMGVGISLGLLKPAWMPVGKAACLPLRYEDLRGRRNEKSISAK